MKHCLTGIHITSNSSHSIKSSACVPLPYLSQRCSSAALRGRRAGFSSILSTSVGFIPILSKCCTVGCILVLTCCRSCAPLLISVIKGVKALGTCPSSDTPSNLNALAAAPPKPSVAPCFNKWRLDVEVCGLFSSFVGGPLPFARTVNARP